MSDEIIDMLKRAEIERPLKSRIAELEAELVQAKLQVARYNEAYQELGDVISHAKCNLLGLKEKPIPDVRAAIDAAREPKQ